MNIRRLILALFLFAFMGVWTEAQERNKPAREQTEFSAEAEGVDHPVPLPGDVLKALETDDRVRSFVEHTDPPVQTPSPSWFSASKVHLAGPREDDVVVLAEGGLRGANVIMFWVFRNSSHGYDLVLRTGGHDLHIKRHLSNGYRDIEVDSVTSMQFNSVLYRFDGTRYVVQRDKTEPIK